MTVIKGRPDLLEQYTAATTATLPGLQAAIDDYAVALAAFNAAPNDDTDDELEDLSDKARQEVTMLREFDAQPAAMAFALHQIDQVWWDPSQPVALGTDDMELFQAILDARLADPNASAVDTMHNAELRLAARLRTLGEQHAREFQDLLRNAGIDPGRFRPQDLDKLPMLGADPDTCQFSSSQRLFDELEAHRLRLLDRDYAIAFYSALGPEGTRGLLGALETLQYRQVNRDDRRTWETRGWQPRDLGRRIEDTLKSVTDGFSLATGAPEMTTTQDVLLRPENRWQQHQLAVLTSANGRNYDPTFLTAAADVILVENPERNRYDQFNVDVYDGGDETYLALHSKEDLYRDEIMRSPEAIVMRSLAQNERASWQFVWDGNQRKVREDHLQLILSAPSDAVWSNRYFGANGIETEEQGLRIGHSINDSNGRILDNILVDAESHKIVDHDSAALLYAGVVRQVGAPGGRTGPPLDAIPGYVKRKAADALILYLNDISYTSGQLVGSGPYSEEKMATGKVPRIFLRPDLVDFFAVLATDREASVEVGQSVMAWSVLKTANLTDRSMPTSDKTRIVNDIARVIGVVESGYEVAGTKWTADIAAARAGAGSEFTFVTDFVLDEIPFGGKVQKYVVGPVRERLLDMVGDDAARNAAAIGSPASVDEFDQTLQLAIRRPLAHHLAADEYADGVVPDPDLDQRINEYFDPDLSPFDDFRYQPTQEKNLYGGPGGHWNKTDPNLWARYFPE